MTKMKTRAKKKKKKKKKHKKEGWRKLEDEDQNN